MCVLQSKKDNRDSKFGFSDKAKEEIAQYLSTIKSEDCQIEIAYFGGSFTGLDMELQREFLEAASGFKDERIIGIRMSTRPDYINKEILEQCVEFGVKTIELGVQSASNRVLELNRRGHVFEDVIRAAEMIKIIRNRTWASDDAGNVWLRPGNRY